jgi:hypothetical protein
VWVRRVKGVGRNKTESVEKRIWGSWSAGKQDRKSKGGMARADGGGEGGEIVVLNVVVKRKKKEKKKKRKRKKNSVVVVRSRARSECGKALGDQQRDIKETEKEKEKGRERLEEAGAVFAYWPTFFGKAKSVKRQHLIKKLCAGDDYPRVIGL